jgi:hypothetical protein
MRRALLLASTIFLASACSLVSGWSDLQGGATGGRKDGGAADGAGSTDASIPGEAGDDASAPSGVRCGAGRCNAPEGCCYPPPGFGGTAGCTDVGTCLGTNGAFLTCDGRASCPGAAPACCFDFGSFTAQCAAACIAGDETICNPSDVPACASGACTRTVPGYTNIPSCQ